MSILLLGAGTKASIMHCKYLVREDWSSQLDKLPSCLASQVIEVGIASSGETNSLRTEHLVSKIRVFATSRRRISTLSNPKFLSH